MLIQNIGSAASASGYTGNSGSAAIVVPSTPATSVEPEQSVHPSHQATHPTDAQLKSAVDSINSNMKQINSNVEFSIQKGSAQAIVEVVDTETGQLISQFPSKAAVAISQMVAQSQPGALVKQEA